MAWVHRWAMAGWELSSVVDAAWTAQNVKGVCNPVWHGIIIAILVMFLVLVILFCLKTCWVLAALAMMKHGIWTSHEKVEASITYRSQLVMPDSQVIDNSTLILPLFATPGAECQTAMMVEGIRGIDILEAHYFGWLQGQYKLKKLMHLCKYFTAWLAAFRSFPSHQVPWISKIGESRRWAEDAISQKTEEGSWDPSCLESMGCDSW